MNKERIKNLLLVFLIAMNFILGSRILIDKKLWPSGYNFFSNINNWDITKIYQSIKNQFIDESIYKSRFLSPEKIIINTGDQTTRLSLNPDDAEFDGILEEAYMVLQKAFSDDTNTAVSVSKEDFHSSLAANSIYLEFSAAYNPEIFARLIGTNADLVIDIPDGFSQVVISYSPKTCVYICDTNNDLFYKINVNKSSEDLVMKIGECVENRQDSHAVINYSFDLKFDQPFGAQKTTISPLVQIYSTPEEYPVIIAKNPILNNDSNVNENIVDDILKVFDINPNTMSRYTEAGGTAVFVENNATLKIDKNGYLEYETTVSSEEASDGYSLISTVSSMADGINKAIKNENAMCLSEVCTGTNGTITLDYMAGGLKVKLTSDKLSNGVVATVENGQLKSYKQLIRAYEVTGKTSVPMEFLTALDTAIFEYSKSMNQININKMYAGYVDNVQDGEKNAEWIVDVDNIIAGE